MGEPRMAMRMVAAIGALAALAACSTQVEAPVDSLTVARVMGQDVAVPPLLPIAGSVWPAQEPPRGTIGNPNAGLMPWDETASQIQQSQPLVAPPVVPGRRGSSTPPDLLAQPEPTPALRQPDMPPYPTEPARPRRRTDGRVIPTPQGPAVTTGGTGSYSTYTNPGGGSGIAIPQGGTTTLLDADGTVRQVPTPR
ncbi:hypothetical protein EBE87_05620 [Pseudoroseomonas wenyumeiae]|nr:hypothetical protein [Pseudoroseomonas wenyumeiae]RMI25881.1 hypothetical protein EBE87_05620 [Pseudoroseomonas wenyumeiae]